MVKHNKCVYCKTDIVLVPSATERAKNCRQGMTAQDYKNLFTAHSDCQTAAWYNRPNPRLEAIAKANQPSTFNRYKV